MIVMMTMMTMMRMMMVMMRASVCVPCLASALPILLVATLPTMPTPLLVSAAISDMRYMLFVWSGVLILLCLYFVILVSSLLHQAISFGALSVGRCGTSFLSKGGGAYFGVLAQTGFYWT